MPTYDYICNDCEKIYEYFQSMSDAPIRECPECKKNSLRRVISGGTGLIFKGSGYYLTDYKNKKKQSSENKKSNKKKKITRLRKK
ncbi:zinc ribbon domain-containing protein [bacterium]|nr:zinc ribbon domain-containing protein [bacterium]